MTWSTTTGNEILDCYFNQTNITAPTAIYVSLHTGDPGLTGANEVSGGSYARVAITTQFPAAASKTLDNDSEIAFTTATGSWGTVTHVGVWTASSGGTFLIGDAVTTSKAVNTDDTASFAAGALDISVT